MAGSGVLLVSGVFVATGLPPGGVSVISDVLEGPKVGDGPGVIVIVGVPVTAAAVWEMMAKAVCTAAV